MTYYCELPNDKNIIRTMNGPRVVGRYVIVTSSIIPVGLTFASKNIVGDNSDHVMQWYKHREKADLTLSKEEREALTFQILKSETW
jgi:hypothetical protein